MAKRRRTGKFAWKNKKSNHGRKPCRGKSRTVIA